ncbi:VOC family protein [Streptomyces albus]
MPRTGRGTTPGGTALHFKEVPEPKPAKNRLHLCLRPNTSRDAEVERLLALGASLAVGHRKPVGWGWAILAGAEGNEFRVLLAESERAALGS